MCIHLAHKLFVNLLLLLFHLFSIVTKKQIIWLVGETFNYFKIFAYTDSKNDLSSCLFAILK